MEQENINNNEKADTKSTKDNLIAKKLPGKEPDKTTNRRPCDPKVRLTK